MIRADEFAEFAQFEAGKVQKTNETIFSFRRQPSLPFSSWQCKRRQRKLRAQLFILIRQKIRGRKVYPKVSTEEYSLSAEKRNEDVPKKHQTRVF